jgi:hypothetical protein
VCLGSRRELESVDIPHGRLVGKRYDTRHGGGGLSRLLLHLLHVLLDQRCPLTGLGHCLVTGAGEGVATRAKF